MNPDRIVIATRGSALALWQANHVKARIAAVMPQLAIELNIIKTSGDLIQDIPLAKVGGKGLFVKEIEQALIDRTADLAVHSMKDVPAELADGLRLVGISSRETPWDALCVREPVTSAGGQATSAGGQATSAGGQATSAGGQATSAGGQATIDSLPRGAKVGTSSMRRQCQLLARRPDLQIAMLRGNVPTRIKKLDAGEFDAIVLAAAGLTRLGMADRITQLLPIELMVPAVAQGVLAIEARDDDMFIAGLVREAMHDEDTAIKVAAERAFLAKMGGSCQTPLAAHAVDREDGGIRLVGMCGMPDGTKILRAEFGGSRMHAAVLGENLADDLLAQGAAEILAATKF